MKFYNKFLIGLIIFVLSLFNFCCSEPKGDTLADALKGASGTRIDSIEQINLTTTSGLPSAKEVLEAKALKSFTEKLEIDNFEKALKSVHEPRDYNHPSVSDDIIFRIKTNKGTWTVRCRILSTDDFKTCDIKFGVAGETNFNRMKTYESKLLCEWILKYSGSR